MSVTTIYKHFPFPAPAGVNCPNCGGKGITGDQYEVEGDLRPDGTRINLVVDVLCPLCLAGAHPDYDPNFDPSAHLDPDNTTGWRTDEEEEQAERDWDSCPSCHGRRYNLVDAFEIDSNGETPDDAGAPQLIMPCGCGESLMADVPAPVAG